MTKEFRELKEKYNISGIWYSNKQDKLIFSVYPADVVNNAALDLADYLPSSKCYYNSSFEVVSDVKAILTADFDMISIRTLEGWEKLPELNALSSKKSNMFSKPDNDSEQAPTSKSDLQDECKTDENGTLCLKDTQLAEHFNKFWSSVSKKCGGTFSYVRREDLPVLLYFLWCDWVAEETYLSESLSGKIGVETGKLSEFSKGYSGYLFNSDLLRTKYNPVHFRSPEAFDLMRSLCLQRLAELQQTICDVFKLNYDTLTILIEQSVKEVSEDAKACKFLLKISGINGGAR